MKKTENDFSTVWLRGLLEGVIFAIGLLLLFWCVVAYPKSQSDFGMSFPILLGVAAGLIIAVLTVVDACSRANRVGYVMLALVCFGFAAFMAYYSHVTSNMWCQILGVILIAPGLNFCGIGKLMMVSMISNICYLLMCCISFIYAIYLGNGEYMVMSMLASIVGGILSGICFTIPPITDNMNSESENTIAQALGKFWRGIVGIFLIFVAVAPFAYSIFF